MYGWFGDQCGAVTHGGATGSCADVCTFNVLEARSLVGCFFALEIRVCTSADAAASSSTVFGSYQLSLCDVRSVRWVGAELYLMGAVGICADVCTFMSLRYL